MTERSLRVMQVNKQESRGGAARVAFNLHQAYCRREVNARMAVQTKKSNDSDVFEILHDSYKSPLLRFFIGFIRRLEKLNAQLPGVWRLIKSMRLIAEYSQRMDVNRGREDYYAPGTWHLLEMFPGSIDILHLHNLHKNWLLDKKEYFDLRALPWLSHRVPVVLTLHDAWLLSGHCAHSFDCDRWQKGCGYCPDLNIFPPICRDSTAFNWQRKREIYCHSNLFVTTPSQWLMEKVEVSILSDGMVASRVIPNGVDLSIFRPGNKEKSVLGLPLDAKVLLISANNMRRNQMKDYQTLKLAIARVSERVHNIVLIVLGDDCQPDRVGRAEVRFVPYQEDIELVARYYRTADAYVHAAKADTFPTSVLEALACGIPVVATDVGGIPEQIKDEETGFLTRVGDPQDMAIKIEKLLMDSELRRRMGQSAQQDAMKRFDLNLQADRYLNWYQEIIELNKQHELSIH